MPSRKMSSTSTVCAAEPLMSAAARMVACLPMASRDLPRSSSSARARASSVAARGENVVDAPADVALTHVAPRWPPCVQVRVVGLQRAAHIHEVLAQEAVEKLALLRSLSDDVGLSLLWMYVDVGARDIDVAAQDDLAPLVVQLLRPCRHPGQEAEVGRIVLAADGQVGRGEAQAAQV